MITALMYAKDSSEDENNLMSIRCLVCGEQGCNTLTLQKEKVNISLGKAF